MDDMAACCWYSESTCCDRDTVDLIAVQQQELMTGIVETNHTLIEW